MIFFIFSYEFCISSSVYLYLFVLLVIKDMVGNQNLKSPKGTTLHLSTIHSFQKKIR